MILIVGLGNPGKKYENTPHNLGFWALDAFQKQHRFSDWRLIKKYNALIAEGKINGQKVLLAKPQTYMNKSGEAVKKITADLRLPIANLFVAHDDADLPFGTLRISHARGSAGHKGVESIILALKSKHMVRFRMGSNQRKALIRRSARIHTLINAARPNLKDVVLKRFSLAQEKTAKNLARTTAGAIEETLIYGIPRAMTKYNQK